jgi:hypothetical protein
MKMQFKEAEKQLVINVDNVGRTKRQKYAFNNLVKSNDLGELLKYVNSFNGTKQRYLGIDKPKVSESRQDILGNKRRNYYLQMFEEMLCTNSESHKPFSKKYNDYVGVEIECFIPFSNDLFDIDPSECEGECSYCDGRGTHENDDGDEYDCDDCGGSGRSQSSEAAEDEAHKAMGRQFRKNKVKWVSIKGDGSIYPDDTDDQFAVEVTVLTRMSDPSNLKKACELLNKMGAKVNKSCGLHVHLDARHLDKNDVSVMAKKFERSLPVMLSMVPKSRRTNVRYCKAGVSPDMNDYDHRYYAINTTAYPKYGTIEIRLHSATTDFNKIFNWAQLLVAIGNSTIPKKCEDLNQLTDYVKLSEDLVEYISQRTALFTPKVEATNPAMLDQDSTDSEDIEIVEQVLETYQNRIDQMIRDGQILIGPSGRIVIDLESA